jgi:NADH-quinone oxidoreductase subunit A
MIYFLAILLQTQGQRPGAPPQAPAPLPPGAPPIYGYIPIIIFFLIAVLLPVVLLGASRLVQRRVFEREKLLPYECGVEPIGDARERFSVRFYIVAMLFLVFDVETVFLFPWAIIYDKLAVFGLVEMLVFIGILVVGYYYAWQKGALEWA